MNAKRTVQCPDAGVDRPEATIRTLIALIDELLEVIGEENAMLARGLPASLMKQAIRKNELADQFDRWVKEVAAHPVSIKSCAPDVQDALMDRIARLRCSMDENIDRLRAAMEASRRRIEAVMQAIRADIAASASYSADARVNCGKGNGASCSLSVRI
jgi:hypothetical protein